jgi:hypothetical protein
VFVSSVSTRWWLSNSFYKESVRVCGAVFQPASALASKVTLPLQSRLEGHGDTHEIDETRTQLDVRRD